METVVERLLEVVDDLATLDPDALSDTELHDAVVALQCQRARLGAVAAKVLARWDGRGVWSGDQSRSAAARLARDTRCSIASARVELRRARKLSSMPATAAAVAAGELSLDHVDLLGRANHGAFAPRFADHEEHLVEQCKQLPFRDAVRMVDYWRQRVDAEAVDDDACRDADSANLHASETIDGTVVLNGVLDRVGGAAVLTELSRLERQLYLADEAAGVVRTAAQRRAAALVEMARRSATGSGGKEPKPLFTVLLGDESFTRLCELAGGHVVAPGSLVPWFDTADMETILFDGPSTVISVSQRRSFTGALRRAIEVRDRHCQHPSGCDTPAADCDVDHIVAWRDGGETSQFNGKIECPPHNRHPDRHDHHGTPAPPRPVTVLDQIRARLRWQYLHEHGADDNPDDDEDDAGGDADLDGHRDTG